MGLTHEIVALIAKVEILSTLAALIMSVYFGIRLNDELKRPSSGPLGQMAFIVGDDELKSERGKYYRNRCQQCLVAAVALGFLAVLTIYTLHRLWP